MGTQNGLLGAAKSEGGLYLYSGAAPAAELAGNLTTPPPGVSISIVVLAHLRPLARSRTFLGLGWAGLGWLAGWAGWAGLATLD